MRTVDLTRAREPSRARGAVVEDLVDPLHLDEVVARRRACRAGRARAPCARSQTTPASARVEPAARLDGLEILVATRAEPSTTYAAAALQHPLELLAARAPAGRRARSRPGCCGSARGPAARAPARTRRSSRSEREQANAAVDVEADPARARSPRRAARSPRRRRPESRSPRACRASRSPASTMPGSVATLTSCSRLRSRPISSSSALVGEHPRRHAHARQLEEIVVQPSPFAHHAHTSNTTST